MLISFACSNFLSFESIQTLSMKAGKGRSFFERVETGKNYKIKKFLALYGANASGKSNIIRAMDYSRRVIISGNYKDYNINYCKTFDENKSVPSSFIYAIELNGEKYEYGFEILLMDSTITKEWLYKVPYGNTKKVLFYREPNNKVMDLCKYSDELTSRMNIYIEDMLTESSDLFLHYMNTSKGNIYEKYEELAVYQLLYEWFKYSLIIGSPENPITNISHFSNEDSVKLIAHLLEKFGTGIVNINLGDITLTKAESMLPNDLIKKIQEELIEVRKDKLNDNCEYKERIMVRIEEDNSVIVFELDENSDLVAKTLQFKHNNSDLTFYSHEESDGTMRLLDLIDILLPSNRERVYVVDEINRRLHPLLTVRFISEFLNNAENSKSQLIVTTHESRLMDFSILRKDEVGFVNKNENGASEIYLLDDKASDVRFDKKIRNAYFHGDYNAIPIFVDN